MSVVTLAIMAVLGFGALLGFLNVLPEGGPLPSGVSDAITLIYGYMQMFNVLFPMDALFQVLLATLTFEAAMFVWRMIRWTLSVVRGANL